VRKKNEKKKNKNKSENKKNQENVSVPITEHRQSS